MTDYQFIVIDAYCRKGGAAKGYRDAGGYVVGFDREAEHKDAYAGHEFYTGDAIGLLRSRYVRTVVADALAVGTPILAHASPPCQEGNAANIGSNAHRGNDHPQLIPATREALEELGIPYVIEQPASSRKGLIRRDLTLCMDMFKGDLEPPWVQKHRSFELGNWPRPLGPKLPHPAHAGYIRGYRHGVNRTGPQAPYVAGYGKGGGKATVAEMRHAMKIDWMTDHFDLREAIPPDYTEYISGEFLRQFA
jgi:hypothetical protein